MRGLVTFSALYLVILPIAAAFILWLRLPKAKKKEFAFVGLAGAGIALAFSRLASLAFYNPRPFVEGHFQPYFSHGGDNGFPSDHTLLAAYLAFLVWQYDRRAGAVLIFAAVAVGAARMVAGVHHLADVVGSFAIAAAAVYLGGIVVKLSYKSRN